MAQIVIVVVTVECLKQVTFDIESFQVGLAGMLPAIVFYIMASTPSCWW